MNYLISIFHLLGFEGSRKRKITPQANEIHIKHKSRKTIDAHLKDNKWLCRRWSVVVFINAMFFLSYWFDIQLMEGSLRASRVLGFHLADLFNSFEIILASGILLMNLLIGMISIFILWFLFGGRAFCSWVCPYHLISELVDRIPFKRKNTKNYQFSRTIRVIFFISFLVLASVTHIAVFELINPVGILSRAVIYGPTIGLVWVFIILLFEKLVSKRAWCRYICPIGFTYGVVGIFSPTVVEFDLNKCFHEGDCIKVCLVPHVLTDKVIKGRARNVKLDIGADCTRCGLCLDVCKGGALKFKFKGVSLLK